MFVWLRREKKRRCSQWALASERQITLDDTLIGKQVDFEAVGVPDTAEASRISVSSQGRANEKEHRA